MIVVSKRAMLVTSLKFRVLAVCIVLSDIAAIAIMPSILNTLELEITHVLSVYL